MRESVTLNECNIARAIRDLIHHSHIHTQPVTIEFITVKYTRGVGWGRDSYEHIFETTR